MSIELSGDLRQAIDQAGTPLRLVDSTSGDTFVVVPESTYATIQALLGESLAETYPAQIESAMRAGWDDPAMDEYNDYDRHRSS
jgi:hypothetical protein